ncbi:cysteine and histidine-rich domain-containing protein RAR1 isoform X1 [Iris pallida]|uniref:Cysteine and histidine-rich domain-containing protein RAR1 isoform X1 n=1 Tax=Iris pallida TaxID=29817 RepID=A0AAX6DFG2_IRIPA|nr:cysteine and histidine-rich domain-containing protein RAR1 isoform X1 [Iris pallida]
MAVRCQRIGCDASFTEDDNADGSCRYHDSGPIFHDGMKEWSCCKQRSHDFSLFLAIPGCKTGKHTTEKPVTKMVSASPQKAVPTSIQIKTTNDSCSRCRQGFFCSDHGSQVKLPKPVVPSSADDDQIKKTPPVPVKKVVGLDEPQTCRNKGCGKTFKEKDNHETACEYHPGPAVFHDRIRGWKCCDIHVKEFDEFMSIPSCAKGWHNADAS